MFTSGLRCHGILTSCQRIDWEKLQQRRRHRVFRKILVAIAVATIASLDGPTIRALQEDLLSIFADSTRDFEDWQIDIVVSTLAVANDVSVASNAKCPLFVEGDFMDKLERRLRARTSKEVESLQSGARQLLDRCAQIRTEWLQREIQGESAEEDKQKNRSKLVSLLHEILPRHIIPFSQAWEKTAQDSEPLQPHTEQTDKACHEAHPNATRQPEPIAFNSGDTDENFHAFLKRQEAAMKLALERGESEERSLEQGNDDSTINTNSLRDRHLSSLDARTASSQSNILSSSGLQIQHSTPVNAAAATSSINVTLRNAYDDARLAAHTRALQRKRPPSPVNSSSNRKVWSAEEENALMDGLEYVRGPHWRDILALYGEGGSLSEILKNRSQVQLKDKARNMKLFFAKHGLEVPEILRAVTGELKKPKVIENGEDDEPQKMGDTSLSREDVVSTSNNDESGGVNAARSPHGVSTISEDQLVDSEQSNNVTYAPSIRRTTVSA